MSLSIKIVVLRKHMVQQGYTDEEIADMSEKLIHLSGVLCVNLSPAQK